MKNLFFVFLAVWFCLSCKKQIGDTGIPQNPSVTNDQSTLYHRPSKVVTHSLQDSVETTIYFTYYSDGMVKTAEISVDSNKQGNVMSEQLNYSYTNGKLTTVIHTLFTGGVVNTSSSPYSEEFTYQGNTIKTYNIHYSNQVYPMYTFYYDSVGYFNLITSNTAGNSIDSTRVNALYSNNVNKDISFIGYTTNGKLGGFSCGGDSSSFSYNFPVSSCDHYCPTTSYRWGYFALPNKFQGEVSDLFLKYYDLSHPYDILAKEVIPKNHLAFIRADYMTANELIVKCTYLTDDQGRVVSIDQKSTDYLFGDNAHIYISY
jgi:hypothetical protein